MSTDYKRIIRDGLWDNNMVFSQSLALCPLLAVTGTATNGLGMGAATTVVLVLSSLIVALFRGIISPEVRIPVFVLIIATIVTLVDMSMNAWVHDLHKVLGLFIPLIVTNCAILGRAESFASKNATLPAVTDGLMMGLGFATVLFTLGATRELIGQGTLFSGAHLMFGEIARGWTIEIANYKGVLLAILPPGAFIGLGSLIAVKNWIDKSRKERARKETPVADEGEIAAT